MLAKCGVQVLLSELFGVVGKTRLDQLVLRAPYAGIDSSEEPSGSSEAR